MKNVIMMTLDEALHPDVENLYLYDLIFIPNKFKMTASRTIKAIYAAFKNIYYFEPYNM